MENCCIIGYGVVGKATAKGFGITKYIDLTGSTISLEDVAKCRFIFLCLPTPTVDGKCDVGVIKKYIVDLRHQGFNGVFVIRSTVIPGTARAIMAETGATIVSNPEFLTEATWEIEAEHPGIIVLGADDTKPLQDVRALYEGRWRGVQVFQADTVTAETIKYALNTFFATKVVFANQVYDFCQTTGANYETVKSVLEFHPWGSKNHFTIWHKKGRGAGGKCLSKDLAAFATASNSELIKEVQRINEKLLIDFPKHD